MARKTTRAHPVGPLKSYEAGFEAVLADTGYTPLSRGSLVWLMRHLSAWLATRGLGGADLAPGVVEEYLALRRADGYTKFLSPRGLTPLLTYLRGLGVAPVPAISAPVGLFEDLVERYRRYLVAERGLTLAAVRRYLMEARVFLAGWVDDSSTTLGEMNAAQVTEFVVRYCTGRSVGSAKYLVTVVRSVLRFLLLDGVVAVDLSGAVPAVAGWRGSHLPRGTTPAKARELLGSCNMPRLVSGRPRKGQGPGERRQVEAAVAEATRDRAILLLLMRLGLRAIEVARLEFDDFDWRRGEVVIRGKGRRDERLPLPADVGEAIADYLQRGRPSTGSRSLFLSVRAPHAPLTRAAVTSVVGAAAGRAGIEGVSPHRLRHMVATEVLNAPAPLAEVGQLLRHRSAATTAIYVKVDRSRLRELAMAWPEVTA